MQADSPIMKKKIQPAADEEAKVLATQNSMSQFSSQIMQNSQVLQFAGNRSGINSPNSGQQLQYRMTELNEPRDKNVAIAYDAKFPTVLSYDNPLVGILNHKRDTSFNFVMLNGDKTQYPCVDIQLEESRIP